MNGRERYRIALAIGLLALSCFGAGLWLVYEAGCIGDTKGGALGDPSRALELEGYALWPEILGLLLIPCVFALIPGRGVGWRIMYGLAFVLAAVFCVQFLGVQAEAFGIRSCLRH